MPDLPDDSSDSAEHPENSGAAPIAWGTLFHYATPLVPVYFLYMMLTVVYMQFATDVLLLGPGIVGTIFFASKVWDAVSDPMIGYLSDGTQSRLGRRKSWMYASIVPMVVMTWMLWSPPESLSGLTLVAWVSVSVIGFYTAFTLFVVPQMAYGVELSLSPHERARVFGGRQISVTLGMLACFVLATPMITGNPEARSNASLLAAIGSFFLAITIAFSTWRLPRERTEYRGRGADNPFQATRDVAKNPHARLLLLVYFIEIFGIGATSAMTPFLLIYVTDATEWIWIVFLFYTVPALVSIPFWIALGKRYERYKVWCVAMGLQAFGYGGILLQEEGRVGLMIACSILNGFAGACSQTLGYSIKGDVIDYDEYKTGERKEGAYLAAWSLAQKFGTGLMIAFSGWALQASGFVANQPQTDFVKWTIKGMTGGAPFICLLVGMVLFSRFKLNGAEADRIRAELAARKSAPNQTSAA